jgi:aspartate carbamoyltransferase catalytic subunit
MPHPFALIEIENLQLSQIEAFFQSAIQFARQAQEQIPVPSSSRGPRKTVALLFFEPSTRTRFSFETAAARLKVHPLLLDAAMGTSLEKGESFEDTVLNLAAMQPSALVIRCDDKVNLYELQDKVSMPILNAGWGRRAHPTQALLDALTFVANGRDLKKEKLLVIGDVKHSRVIGSHFQLCKLLGYEIAICGPQKFLPENYRGRSFVKLEEGLKWATSLMALRLQHERHDSAGKVSASSASLQEYRAQYGLDLTRLRGFESDGFLLHPGPVNYGVELELNVNEDSRCKILEQVKWGTYLRQAVLAQAIFQGHE